MNMAQPCLFADLPVMEAPKRILNGVEITSLGRHRATKSEKQAMADLQMDLFMQLLAKPVISGARKFAKTAKRLIGWEDASAFTSEMELTQQQRKSESNALTMDWTNDVLVDMHRWVFDEALEALKAEQNQAEKMDILEWIYSPDYIDKLGKSTDGRPCVIRRHATDIPFSFVNCCKAVGLSDPDIFREELVENLSEQLKPAFRKFLTVLTGKVDF